MIKSPLTNAEAEYIQSLEVSTIVADYKKDFNIDVSPYFQDIADVKIYQCKESKLKFYYPFSLAGDAAFYEQLSINYGGYYSPWKWEHQKVYDLLSTNQNVLEIGCGNGYFLQKIQHDKQASGVGLDFNPASVAYGVENGIKILSEDIAVHATQNTEKYDLVCAFQLFEHVNDVGTFLKQTIDTLKKGGKLAIGVPNNDSFAFRADPYHTLNTPPHHMLLWDATSLAYLAKMFGLEIVEIVSQPNTRDFKGAMYALWLRNTLGDNIVSKTIHQLTRWVVKSLPVFQEGQTVLAIYSKQ